MVVVRGEPTDALSLAPRLGAEEVDLSKKACRRHKSSVVPHQLSVANTAYSLTPLPEGVWMSLERYSEFTALATSGAPNTNSYQFTGREIDGSTGLYFYRARYYSPTFGRFISEDL